MDIQHIAVPVAGKDYPRNWNEFLDRFGSEEACVTYLEGLRWPQGFVCPNCGVMAPASRASRGRLLCKDCGHQSTVTAGTIFDKDAHAAARVVGWRLVPDQSEAGGERPGAAACTGLGQLPDSVDDAASVPQGDGAA